MDDIQIIGISGTNGSGKDTVGELLESEHGFKFISVTDMLRDECRARGLVVGRENLRMISAQWRQASGLGVVIDKAIEAFRADENKYTGLAIASLRNPGESKRVHELGGQVWWTDADPELRYTRVTGSDRGRSSEDDKTYEQFIEEEAAEMHPAEGADETALHSAAVRDMADAMIVNEGTLDALRQQIVAQLS